MTRSVTVGGVCTRALIVTRFTLRTDPTKSTLAQPTAELDTPSIAELNDLLQLDDDALTSYDVNVRELGREDFRATVREYRRDHERHVG